LDRAGEHQTGNPRELMIVAEVHSTAVTELESAMHSLFASRRVLREWFFLPPDDVALVIETASRLAAEQFEDLRVAETVNELAQLESTGELLKADDAMIAWWERWDQSRLALEAVTAADKQLDQLFRSLVERSGDLRRVAAFSRVKKPSLDQKRLRAEHPDLFAAYVTSEGKVSGRKSPRESRNTLDLGEHDSDLAEVISRVTPVISTVQREPDSVQLAHELHLILIQYKKGFEWRKERAALNLQSLCGTAPGIEGLITWNRRRTISEKFDKERFEEENADLAAAYTVMKTSSKFVTQPNRNYPFTVPTNGSDLRPARLLLGQSE